jgi:hypothetical protein
MASSTGEIFPLAAEMGSKWGSIADRPVTLAPWRVVKEWGADNDEVARAFRLMAPGIPT